MSTRHLTDRGIESLFRRADIILRIENDQTVPENGSRDSESGMYTLLLEKSKETEYFGPMQIVLHFLICSDVDQLT